MSRKPRSVEEQAALDAALSHALEVVAEENARRAAVEEDFVRPSFTRRTLAAALDVPDHVFDHWQTREQVTLDADAKRAGKGWRLYSARDVLRLGIATRLSQAGFPASKLRSAIGRIEAAFPLSTRNPALAANVPVVFAVLPSGEVIGPAFGPDLDLSAIPAGVFIVLRMDTMIRASLERLGLTMTTGNAADHRAAIKRLAGPEGAE